MQEGPNPSELRLPTRSSARLVVAEAGIFFFLLFSSFLISDFFFFLGLG